ncbi:helix-turn-helix domain-containing protein [Arthrobacter oryzae]|uniref:PucR family transcriptional regulator n=1 Tax=Arthrobacter oryzae TaxID=409290 RepID=UPI00285614D0|nr:helix-turn-helix domain-containing protein [Arthrobacter oryzae]MDR6507629.1 DNA-binding PucR family transcriptional regulator [Arthrobacter oryzae]
MIALNAPALLSDASLLAEDRELNRSDLVQWLTSNIQRPGIRVDVYVGPRTAAYIGDLVSRGIAPNFAAGWRSALAVGWRGWLTQCVSHCSEPDVLVEVLDISAHSLVQYALDSVSVLREASLAAAMGNAGADAVELIQLIASGAPMTQDFVEERLSYRLARQHVALVLWTDDPHQGSWLDEAVSALRSAAPRRALLVARASAAARWIWISGQELPDFHHLEKTLMEETPVRGAVGRPGHGLEGFKSSHQDALAAQAMLTRLGSGRQFTVYADVELVDSLTKDRAGAQRFVARTLGPLAEAEVTLQQALLTYVQCGFNTTRAASRLYLHRNTVERRVSKANELSVVKVEDNPAHVAAALLVLEIVPGIMGAAST